MKKIIVAVSGGVDSVVLLDFLYSLASRKKLNYEIIVAHFDHGIRPDSHQDLKFVQELALRYNLQFEFDQGNLGANASEDLARTARYNFLRRVSKQHGNAKIVTAHHTDDLVETVLINTIRGTGWRGLAVLDSKDIWRPFLGYSKEQIIKYAKKRKLNWREDSTNSSNLYLRNRLRNKLVDLPTKNRRDIFKLWQAQLELKRQIDEEVSHIIKTIKNINDNSYPRSFFIQIDESEAIEILRSIIIEQTGETPTRIQTTNFWLNIKTIKSGKKIQLLGGRFVRFNKSHFIFE